ncbi:MAG: hypothetical protein M3M85_03585 [bacterium]|nr:hypothetical protein [bacterium]
MALERYITTNRYSQSKDKVSDPAILRDKIIKAFVKNNNEGIHEEEREDFLRRLAHKDITDAEITSFLTENGNSFGERNMLPILALKEALQNSAGHRMFLNLLLSKPPQNSVSVPAIMSVLDTYASPDRFEKLIEKTAGILAGQREVAADAQRHGAELAKLLYGEKQDLWEQLKILREEAEGKYERTFEDSGIKIRNLEEEEVREILSKVEVHGDPWQGKLLKSGDLETEGVGPRIKIEIGGYVLYCSYPYEWHQGRRVVVGYIRDKNEEFAARSFYLSNSQGIWKYLPKYLMLDGRLAWLQKGYGEESLSLPTEFQRALAHIDKENPLSVNVKNPDFIFEGLLAKPIQWLQKTHRGQIRTLLK